MPVHCQPLYLNSMFSLHKNNCKNLVVAVIYHFYINNYDYNYGILFISFTLFLFFYTLFLSAVLFVNIHMLSKSRLLTSFEALLVPNRTGDDDDFNNLMKGV